MLAMRWPWPPAARKFIVRLVVRRAEGLPCPPAPPAADAAAKVVVEVKWKGPKARWKGLRVCRNRTHLEPSAPAPAVVADDDGGADAAPATAPVVAWEEEFEDVVMLTATSYRKAAAFHPWDLSFSVLNILLLQIPESAVAASSSWKVGAV